MAVKKTSLEQASAKIIERQGKKEAAWKAEVLEQAQINFFRGKDKDLEDYVLNKARQELVLKEINK